MRRQARPWPEPSSLVSSEHSLYLRLRRSMRDREWLRDRAFAMIEKWGRSTDVPVNSASQGLECCLTRSKLRMPTAKRRLVCSRRREEKNTGWNGIQPAFWRCADRRGFTRAEAREEESSKPKRSTQIRTRPCPVRRERCCRSTAPSQMRRRAARERKRAHPSRTVRLVRQHWLPQQLAWRQRRFREPWRA